MPVSLGRALPAAALYGALAVMLALNGVYLYARMFGSSPGDGGGGDGPGADAIPQYPLYDTLVVFGDSITQAGGNPAISGFVAHLAAFYTRRMDVLNRGFSGYNTRNALSVVDSVFPRALGAPRQQPRQRRWWPHPDSTFPAPPRPPQLCLLFFGANDARLPPYAQHVPLSEFAANMRRLIAVLHDPESPYYSPATRIMLITPPAVGDRMIEEIARRNGHAPDRKNAEAQRYAAAVRAVAAEHSLPVVDLWSAIESLVRGTAAPDLLQLRPPHMSMFDSEPMDHAPAPAPAPAPPANATGPYEGYERFLSDGLHLNAAGNELLFKLIAAELLAEWPDMNPLEP
ncbi:isoamyl acetate-hydrolyzing esterase [Coemansia javaensis]|uniref:Isoamyl acetate-hydrolyzing esterase n=1 Tax=Coemansia javaensis TaxID=2761396 RepID=A0A9W8LIC4_9FUNG|nr:isoamyl acetate-hydrolyzing esterase [Coemansia javaensis]